MNHYIDWIDKQIEEYQREIVKLTIAREVIAKAGKTIGGDIQLVARAVKQKVQRKPRLDRELTREVRRHIIVACNHDWLKPKQIVEAVRVNMPEASAKTVWNSLFNLRQKGLIARNTKGAYIARQEAAKDAA